MKTFCLTKELADKLKAAAVKGDINIEAMYGMTSKQRRDLFSKYVDADTASKVNAGFEKAMSSTQQTALETWAKNTFKGQEDTPKYRDITTKIEALNEMGLLTPKNEDAFFQDLVASELGATVSAEEASTIAQKASKIGEYADKVNDLGLPVKEYFIAKKEMDDYLDSLDPSSNAQVLTDTIARGNLLFRASSAILNIEANSVNGLMEGVMRRIETKNIRGMNSSTSKNYIKYAIDVYIKTGYDVTRMDTYESSRKILGEERTNVQGKGIIRKAGRFYTDVVFEKMQGAPDVLFSAIARADRADLMSSRVIASRGLKGEQAKIESNKLLLDSLRVVPTTPEGKIIKDNAIADAKRSTFQHDTIFSKKASELRKVMDVGDLKFGKMTVPFVKTASNAISVSLEASGITVPVSVISRTIRTVKAVQETGNWKSANSWAEISKASFSGFSREVIRAGIGATTAFLLANAIDEDDFIGIYPTNKSERELLESRNAAPNSIKIGGNWISLDYFGFLAAPIVGHLYAKKYKTDKDFKNYVYNYIIGSANQITNTPGIEELNNTVSTVLDVLTPNDEKGIDQRKEEAVDYVVNYIAGRSIPGDISNLGKVSDKTDRDPYISEDVLAPIKRNIPFIRESLPAKIDVLGNEVQTEGWKTLLFGSRVKTAKEDIVVDELVRLHQKDQLPTITDVRWTSPRMKELRQQLGVKKSNEAFKDLGSTFKREMIDLFDSEYYKGLNDEQKKDTISSIKSDIFEYILYKYGYKPAVKAR